MDLYSIKDYEKAQSELERLERCWENYSGNNPNKYRARIKLARSTVSSISEYLKEQGQIPYSEKEILQNKLCKKFPEAQSKDVVEFEGQRYKLVFYPKEKSRSGNVLAWGKEWKLTQAPVSTRKQQVITTKIIPDKQNEVEDIEYISDEEAISLCQDWIRDYRHEKFSKINQVITGSCDFLAQARPLMRTVLLDMICNEIGGEAGIQIVQRTVIRWNNDYGDWPLGKGEIMS